MEKKVYEAKTNVYIPARKSTSPKGTRFTIIDGNVTIGDEGSEDFGVVDFPLDNEFKILIRHGFLRELSEEEIAEGEKVVRPKVRDTGKPRKKMPVEIIEERSTPIKKRTPQRQAAAVEENEEDDGSPKVRGMKVTVDNATPIATRKIKSSKDEKKIVMPPPGGITEEEFFEDETGITAAKRAAGIAVPRTTLKKNAGTVEAIEFAEDVAAGVLNEAEAELFEDDGQFDEVEIPTPDDNPHSDATASREYNSDTSGLVNPVVVPTAASMQAAEAAKAQRLANLAKGRATAAANREKAKAEAAAKAGK